MQRKMMGTGERTLMMCVEHQQKGLHVGGDDDDVDGGA